MQIPQTEWERVHYRLGLAGEGHADIIEMRLAEHRGVLLDIGCGPQGHHAGNLAKWCRYLVAADKDLGMVESASRDYLLSSISFVAANAYDLPFSEAAFDGVIGLGLLAYITEVEQLLRELRRVTRRGGRIILTDSVVRDRRRVLAAAEATDLRLLDEAEGLCPAASGPIKRRYLWVLEAK